MNNFKNNHTPCPFGRTRPDLSNQVIDTETKKWVARDIIEGPRSGVYWDNFLNLAKGRSASWAKILKDTGDIKNHGRPSIFASNDVKELDNMVQQGNYDTTKKEWLNKATELARDRLIDQHNDLTSSSYVPSRWTIKRTMNQIEVHQSNADKTTIARANAMSDIRNVVTYLAGNHAMMGLVNYNLMINSDATQFSTGGSANSKVEVIVKDGRNTSTHPLKVETSPGEVLTCLFIKFYLTISCGGMIGTPIFIIADDRLENGITHWCSVNGLGMNNENGFLVMVKDRSLCTEFYEKMLKLVVVPLIKKIKESRELDEEDLSWFTLDGETKQIMPMMSDIMQNLFAENSIAVAKTPGSTTEGIQPCDQEIFETMKGNLKYLKDPAINTWLEEVLIQAFDGYDKKLKLGKFKQTKKAIQGLIDINYVMNKSLNVNSIQKSFRETGMFNTETKTYDVDKMISKFKFDRDDYDMLDIVTKLPRMAKIILEKGELSDAEMTEIGIPETTNKDHLVLNRRRTVFITNPNVVIKEQEKLLQKETKKQQKIVRTSSSSSKSSKIVVSSSSSIRSSTRKRTIKDLGDDFINGGNDSDSDYDPDEKK